MHPQPFYYPIDLAEEHTWVHNRAQVKLRIISPTRRDNKRILRRKQER